MFEDSVLKFCNKNNIHSCDLLLAVSGGCDSISLLHIFSILKKQLNIDKIGIVHINHGLRPKESEKEKIYVEQLAKKNGYRFHYKKLSGKKLQNSGIENWARNERYQFFKEVRQKYKYKFVATGHNANDQAETIIMKIARGSGINGLCGIQHIRNDGIIRPLIMIPRKTIKSWLISKKISWFDDSTNTSLRYKRNWVRHSIIPLLINREQDSIKYLSKIAQNVQKMLFFLEPIVNKWISDHVIEENKNGFVLRKPFFQSSSFLVYEGTVSLFRRHSIPFDRKHIKNFLKNTKKNTGKYLLKNNWQYFPSKTSVIITKNPEEYGSGSNHFSYKLATPGTTRCDEAGFEFIIESITKNENELDFDMENKIIYIDADMIKNQLFFRYICKTDVFHPLGYSKSIPLIQYLKKQKIGSFFRQHTGAVADSMGEIVWIPDIAVSHKFRIRPKTEILFRISYRRIS
ncbi:MAG: tRNA lysidine(34) synthetase TilS [Chitinispirillia bacterium]|jgi:tRNA(Ile)-lysidine synthase